MLFRSLPVIVVSHNGPKNQNYPGLQGVTPWHVFAFFLRVKKEGGPQARPEKDGYSGAIANVLTKKDMSPKDIKKRLHSC